jgi:uncharacterized protein DUF547
MRIISKINLIFLFGLLTNLYAQSTPEEFFIKSNQFFNKYVDNGRVDYESIKNDPAELNKLVDAIGIFDVSKLKKGDENKAFTINVYNILVIKSVINNYPLKSVMDTGGFFDKNIINIAGLDLSLNGIEKGILFKNYPDSRLHFVLVCAAIGCPEIIDSAYWPANLEEKLDRRTHTTLNDQRYVKVDKKSKTVFVSELFKWYEKDFTKNGLSILQYVNMYREEKITTDYSLSYTTYDWSLNIVQQKETGFSDPNVENLQAYTPSTLLKPGQIEVKLFNNLYTQTTFFDENSKKKDQNSRSTYFTGIINSLYGISSDFNVGLDLYIKSVRNDSESSSPFSLFEFSSDANARTALAQVGPKIKISPFKSFRNLAFQSTFLIPLQSDLDGNESDNSPYLDVDGTQWWTQVFYDYSIDHDFLLYLESGLFFPFDSETEDFFTPIKVFINYYPSQDWTIYFPVEFTSFWKEGSISAHYSQLGLGGKYQLNSNFELEILYTKFIFGKSKGAGATYNFGIRFIM